MFHCCCHTKLWNSSWAFRRLQIDAQTQTKSPVLFVNGVCVCRALILALMWVLAYKFYANDRWVHNALAIFIEIDQKSCKIQQLTRRETVAWHWCCHVIENCHFPAVSLSPLQSTVPPLACLDRHVPADDSFVMPSYMNWMKAALAINKGNFVWKHLKIRFERLNLAQTPNLKRKSLRFIEKRFAAAPQTLRHFVIIVIIIIIASIYCRGDFSSVDGGQPPPAFALFFHQLSLITWMFLPKP